MASERRQAQIAKRIQQKISELLLHEIRDPRIGFVTITGVTITRDLTIAKVRWSVLEEKQKSRVEHMFEHAKGFLRREVAREINIRSAPTLKFEYDQGLAAAARIEEVLRKVLPPEERGPDVPPADLGRDDG